MVITTGEDLPIATLTNDSYPHLLAASLGFECFGGSEPIPLGGDSIDRFLRASAAAVRQPLA